MKPLISVIVPVYNVEKYLDECIQSLLKQTYDHIEIILVDDESKDSSGLMCDKYANEYKNINVFHKNNGGLGYARNTGLEHANGEYLIFLDSDDYLDVGYIENFYKEMISNYADACMGGYTSVQGDNQTVVINGLAGNTFVDRDILKKIVPLMCGRDKNGISVQMSACMVMYKTSIINDFKLRFSSEREYISEDLLFNIDYLGKCKRVVCTDITGYYYRYNSQSLTHTYLVDRLEKQKKMTSKIVEVTTELGIYDLCEQRILNTFLGWTRSCLKMEQENEKHISTKIKYIESICNDTFIQECINKQKRGEDKSLSLLINQMIKYKCKYVLLLVMYLKSKLGV